MPSGLLGQCLEGVAGCKLAAFDAGGGAAMSPPGGSLVTSLRARCGRRP